MKILVAVDGSPYTKRMLAYLAAHEEWLGGAHQYTLLHSVAALPPRAVALLDSATVKGYYDEESEKVFAPIRKFFEKQGIQARFVSATGHAADNICAAAAKSKADLIAMGSHGHGSVVNMVMGSVATKVLAHSKTPVLLIR
jgi:nucleotide-binding universal stress UspA family protein